ncbi:hypothetical protein ABZ461_37320 [Actinacidiphila glaucinigra]
MSEQLPDQRIDDLAFTVGQALAEGVPANELQFDGAAGPFFPLLSRSW